MIINSRKSSLQGSLLYHVSSTDVKWRRMYNVMNDLKTKYTSIEDYSVLSSTLEQLFLLFAKAADKSNRNNAWNILPECLSMLI